MLKSKLSVALLTAAAMALAAGTADAHARLLRADPAPNGSAVGSPRMIHATFSEPLIVNFSGMSLFNSRGKPVFVGKAMSDPRDKATLMVEVPKPLPVGTYLVRWRAVTADTHRMTGQYNFRVR